MRLGLLAVAASDKHLGDQRGRQQSGNDDQDNRVRGFWYAGTQGDTFPRVARKHRTSGWVVFIAVC